MSSDRTERYPASGYPYGYRYMMWPPPWAGYSMPYGYPPAYPMPQTPEAELEMLESYMKQLEGEREAISGEIEGIEARIEELNNIMEEGAPTDAQPRFGPTPFWGPAPYGPAYSPGQERRMLEQQADALERQIEGIKKRLEGLSGGE
jgi:hypothetical protein